VIISDFSDAARARRLRHAAAERSRSRDTPRYLQLVGSLIAVSNPGGMPLPILPPGVRVYGGRGR
jgi:hypothetical protein